MRQRVMVGIVAIAAAGCLATAAGRWLPSRHASHPDHSGTSGTSAHDIKQAVDGYFCPMHPEVHQSGPGQCPICGMNLVADHKGAGAAAPMAHGVHAEYGDQADHAGHELQAEPAGQAGHNLQGGQQRRRDDAQGHEHRKHEDAAPPARGNDRAREDRTRDSRETSVSVDPATQQRLGVVLETAKVTPFANGLRLPAQVLLDERGAVSVSPKAEGWVRRLHVAAVGEIVRAGQVLYELYSPELLQRQREYLDILTRRDALTGINGNGVMAAVGNTQPDSMMTSIARERYRLRQVLAASDLAESVIAELEQSRRVRDVIPVQAVHDGVVTAIAAREGAYVMPAQPVIAYADPRAAAVELTLSPEQLGTMAARENVLLRSTVDRSVTVNAAVERDRAVVDGASRQVRLRVALPATAAVRRGFPPGSLAQAELRAAPRALLSVPRDAVLQGGDGDVVLVAEGGVRFRTASVESGADNGERIEIRSGLKPGDRVVVNGQFLIGAEASLQAARQRLRAGAVSTAMTAPAGAGAHDGH